jgi:transcriptional regulator with XRE-family HTH domain
VQPSRQVTPSLTTTIENSAARKNRKNRDRPETPTGGLCHGTDGHPSAGHSPLEQGRDYKDAYDALSEEFDLARAPIEARTAAGMSPSQLARRMKTSQSYIARIEGGRVRPSTEALQRFAQAARTRLRIVFEPEPAIGPHGSFIPRPDRTRLAHGPAAAILQFQILPGRLRRRHGRAPKARPTPSSVNVAGSGTGLVCP